MDTYYSQVFGSETRSMERLECMSVLVGYDFVLAKL